LEEEIAALRDFSPLNVRSGSNSVIRPMSAQCPVLPKADTARRFMRTRP